ncbi:hypothetical protein SAMN05444320_102285 [Streptoalloteichus hindustanus]|uniref:Uncharacterized protein n=1 Tax=Streptoalloteichus hindustanus TaxID=2017 RepID=A0A1M4Y9K9_STRHI|nr:hypothetical protein SAMN05444320_102285 [Streptoalloteichus hindustanus]
MRTGERRCPDTADSRGGDGEDTGHGPVAGGPGRGAAEGGQARALLRTLTRDRVVPPRVRGGDRPEPRATACVARAARRPKEP